MDSNKKRRTLKAKRRSDNTNNQDLQKKDIPSKVFPNRESVSVKRQREDIEAIVPNKRLERESKSSNYSADSRLKKYRKTLAEKRNEIVKVHTLQNQDSLASSSKDEIAVPNKKCRLSNNQQSSKVLFKVCKQKAKVRNSHTSTHASNSTKTASNDNDVEMDWSPIDENTIMSDIQNVRQNVLLAPREDDYKLLSNEANLTLDSHNLYVIIDTNVFLSNLNQIRHIMELKGNREIIIVVPWIVIQELDYMKDGRSGSKSVQPLASKAINFINEQLISNPLQFRGERIQDAITSKFSSSSADDSILNCCLQIQGKGKTCVLISNDTNLRNKTIINGLQAFNVIESLHNISSLIEDKDVTDLVVKAEEIKISLGNLFSFIIMKQMNKCYGDIWNRMKLMDDPPWSFVDCLERIKHYWSSIFKMDLQKQALKVIEDIITFFDKKKCTNAENFQTFLDLSLSLCYYFKNAYSMYSKNIDMCIREFHHLST